jgi:hypothetical protein
LAAAPGEDTRRPHQIEIERPIWAPDGRVERRPVEAAGSPLARGEDRLSVPVAQARQAREIAAGERLHADWLRAGFAHIAVSDLTRMPGAGARTGGSASDSALDARARVRRALAAVGPELEVALSFACLRLAPFDALERDQKWPRGAGRTVVKLALTRLAAVYGA